MTSRLVDECMKKVFVPDSVTVLDDAFGGDVKVEVAVVSFVGPKLLTRNHKKALQKTCKYIHVVGSKRVKYY